MSEYEFIVALTLIFSVAAVLLVVASRYSLPTVPFYVLAGVFIGGFIDEGQLFDLAQWGIAFLVFAFAVQFEPLSDETLGRDAWLVGVVQITVTGTITYAAAHLVGFTGLQAVYFAIAGTLSSSLVALSLLERRVRLRSLHERLAEALHFVEDVAAILIILVLHAVVYTDGTVLTMLAGVGLLVGALAFRRFVFDRVATLADGDVEILMLTAISLIIGFVALAELTGVSIVVGAFAAGLAVTSEYPHDIGVVDAIGSLEDFFAPIFFVTVGAFLTFPLLSAPVVALETVGVAAVLVAVIVVLNPLVIYGSLRWRGYDSRTAFLTGYSLDQVSEFALIIAIEALVAGLLVEALFDAIVLAAIITMLGSVAISRYAEDWYRQLVGRELLTASHESIARASRVPDDLAEHVIITGFDREGKQLVAVCEELDHPYLVIETDPNRRDQVRKACDNYVFGDTMADATWAVARADEAALIVATTPRRAWAKHVLSLEVGSNTIVRAVNVESGVDLLERGALFVAVPDTLAAEQLRDNVEALLAGDMTREELRELAAKRLDRAVEYGPSDVARVR
ncbi:cation:proton antiporter [Natronosalvus vescus]|uniref:cation:proton antiporter n=1 Tax=Natronosalvus vescus TaxID=2953881 RepID=UPI0020913789|nr:cation:proton antiporter [Natronosalvus vescus]